MPEAKIKKHTTVVITEEMITPHLPCGAGLENAKPFLPAKISTDPHKNLKLAMEWAKTERPWDLSWLMSTLAQRFAEVPAYNEAGTNADGSDYDWSKDPWVIAQNFAALADKLATDQGR